MSSVHAAGQISEEAHSQAGDDTIGAVSHVVSNVGRSVDCFESVSIAGVTLFQVRQGPSCVLDQLKPLRRSMRLPVSSVST